MSNISAYATAVRRLVGIEVFKLRTTPAAYIALAVTVLLGAASVVAGIETAGHKGTPRLGTVDNVNHTLAVSAMTAMVMLVMGVLMSAGDFRHRTVIGSYLGEPRRGRVLTAQLVTAGGLGAVLGAVIFGLALALAVPLYAARGIHHLDVDLTRLWAAATLATACFGLLGVALGALTRNTTASIIGALVWVQGIEVGLLQSAIPDVAKWLPTGAAVALTSAGSTVQHLLAPVVAAVVLVGWAAVLSLATARFTLRREVR